MPKEPSISTRIDYTVTSDRTQVLFRPLTPRALEAFSGLPLEATAGRRLVPASLSLDADGCYRTSSDDEANALFERLDGAGLIDFTA